MASWRLSLAALLVVVCVLAGAAGSGFAQQASPEPREEVVITGRSEEAAIRAFVDDLARDRAPENQLARWDRSICPGVAGLQAEYARFVLRRIWQRAREVGLEAGRSGCRVDILIIVSTDANATARELVDRYPRVLGKFQQYGESTPGRESLQAFRTSAAPVRWWFVSNTATVDGTKISQGPDGAAPVVRVPNASLINRQTRQDFSRAFMIVDAGKIMGVELSALADYLAMAALAQIDAGADTSSYSTILNLFSAPARGDAPMSAMTTWDLAYLSGLYKAPRAAASAKAQERDIARRMNRTVAPK